MQPPSICQLLWDTQGPSNLISDQTSRISSYAPLLWHNPLNWWDLPEDEEFVITNFCFLGNLSLKLSPAKRSKKLELSWKIDNWWWWSLWFAETLTKERIAMYCLTLPTNANDAQLDLHFFPSKTLWTSHSNSKDDAMLCSHKPSSWRLVAVHLVGLCCRSRSKNCVVSVLLNRLLSYLYCIRIYIKLLFTSGI